MQEGPLANKGFRLSVTFEGHLYVKKIIIILKSHSVIHKICLQSMPLTSIDLIFIFDFSYPSLHIGSYLGDENFPKNGYSYFTPTKILKKPNLPPKIFHQNVIFDNHWNAAYYHRLGSPISNTLAIMLYHSNYVKYFRCIPCTQS